MFEIATLTNFRSYLSIQLICGESYCAYRRCFIDIAVIHAFDALEKRYLLLCQVCLRQLGHSREYGVMWRGKPLRGFGSLATFGPSVST